ncbi:MAG: hypothetical protein KF749_03050 [Bacteroidetes bacterium]|nr:hypothetical protein [Bacteroidota bacterium]MCW5896794.1 hypothetical protein [Bacteroidota bacterium]
MFHAPYGGHSPRQSKVLQYWAVFLDERKQPVALFEQYDVAVLFKEMMIGRECSIKAYAFRPEGDRS